MSLNTSLQHAHACADQLVNAVVDAHKEAVASEPFAELMLLDIITQARAMLSKLNGMAGACPVDPEPAKLSDEQQARACNRFRELMASSNSPRVLERGAYDLIEDFKMVCDLGDMETAQFAELCSHHALRELLHLLDGMWTSAELKNAVEKLGYK